MQAEIGQGVCARCPARGLILLGHSQRQRLWSFPHSPPLEMSTALPCSWCDPGVLGHPSRAWITLKSLFPAELQSAFL